MGDPTAAGGTRPPGTGRVYSSCWGSHKDGVPVGGLLKPDVKLTGADRPHRLGDYFGTFEGMRHIVVASSMYDHADAHQKTKTEWTGRSRGRKSSKPRRPKLCFMMTSTIARHLSLSAKKS